MSAAGHHRGAGDERDRFRGVAGVVAGTAMLVRRAAIARLVADAAGVTQGDRVVDVGCGPGGAVREAARRGAYVTGVDPAPLMLRLGRYLTRGPLRERATFRPGTAEHLPLPGESESV
ncbi:MAG: class I SAM-dependent methyltransferase, partial [Nocardiopsaceae bacterium]|nr:class I SAM-dependent methyltransferase [Nocardiopsaceae bacterium]